MIYETVELSYNHPIPAAPIFFLIQTLYFYYLRLTSTQVS